MLVIDPVLAPGRAAPSYSSVRPLAALGLTMLCLLLVVHEACVAKVLACFVHVLRFFRQPPILVHVGTVVADTKGLIAGVAPLITLGSVYIAN